MPRSAISCFRVFVDQFPDLDPLGDEEFSARNR